MLSRKSTTVTSRQLPNTIKQSEIAWVKNYLSTIPSFLKAKILKQTGVNTYLAQVNNIKSAYHRHKIHFEKTIDKMNNIG